MRILKLELSRFKRLEVPGIKRLKLTIDNNFQVIIGSNGSGKTSILNELLPNAPTKTLYPKDSYKRMELEHNNSIYELVYSHEHGHLFIKDGENLNNSTKMHIQLELLKKHFNLDGNTTQILRGSLPIVSMKPSQRQRTLIELNPVDIGIFVEEKNTLRKRGAACANQLSLLYKRQAAVSAQLLPIQEIEEMEKEVAVLNDDEKVLLVNLTTISTTLKELSASPCFAAKCEDKRTLIHTSRKAVKAISELCIPDKQGAVEAIYSSTQKEKDLLTRIKEIDSSIDVIVKDIDEHEKKLDEVRDRKDTSIELNNLKKQLNSYNFVDPTKGSDYFIGKDRIDSCKTAVQQIEVIIDRLSNLEYSQIWSIDEMEMYKESSSSCDHDLADDRGKLEVLNIRLTDIQKQIRNYKIASDCNKDNCELFHAYTDHMTQRKEVRDKLQQEISSLKKMENDHRKISEDIKPKVTEQTFIWEQLLSVLRMAEGFPELFRVIDRDNIHNQLNSSSSRFIASLYEFVQESADYISWCEVNDRMKTLKLKDETTGKVNDTAVMFITENIDKLKRNRKELTKQIDKIHFTIASLRSQRSNLEEYIHNITLLENNQKLGSELLEHQEVLAHHQYLTRVYAAMSAVLAEVRKALDTGATFIKNQRNLLHSLDHEINANIEEIKTEKHDLGLLENALKELSFEYIRAFLNRIISVANKFIEEIFNYSVIIQPIGEGDIDFIFPVVINDNVHVRDVNECSDAQRVIIEVSLNLALILELDLTDYPLLLDEKDRSLDPTIRENLYSLLLSLSEQGIVSQMFIINHHTDFISSQFSDTIVLDATNLKLTNSSELVNSNTVIEYYD